MPAHPPHAASSSPGLAVITGGSSGLGAIFAEHLAALGYDLLLIARSEANLQKVATSIRQHAQSNVEWIACDLTDDKQLHEVCERLASLNSLSLLVNNAGFGTMGDFREIPIEKHRKMVQLHVDALISLTHAVLPGMIARGSGDIIQVSSMSAFLIAPGSAVYAATKDFVKSFTDSLAVELEGTGVYLQGLYPGMTRTGFHSTGEFAAFDKKMVPESYWMSADFVVASSLKAMQQRRISCIPGWKNWFFSLLFHIRPIRELAGRKVRKQEK